MLARTYLLICLRFCVSYKKHTYVGDWEVVVQFAAENRAHDRSSSSSGSGSGNGNATASELGGGPGRHRGAPEHSEPWHMLPLEAMLCPTRSFT